jgi:hypothetical protein
VLVVVVGGGGGAAGVVGVVDVGVTGSTSVWPPSLRRSPTGGEELVVVDDVVGGKVGLTGSVPVNADSEEEVEVVPPIGTTVAVT